MGPITKGLRAIVAIGALALTAPASAQFKPPVVHDDGSVDVPAFTLPFSKLASPEAAEYMVWANAQAQTLTAQKDIPSMRKALDDKIVAPLLLRHKARYAVDIEEQTIDGVFVQVFTPKDGVAPKNKNRVLINLHGGAFLMGARTMSLLESIPLAALGKIKVISIDYRQAPEHRFPAASEDVATVYRALLKTHKPADMVIYGCSAGGILTGEAMAWFQKEGLPNPAAAGVFCAAVARFGNGDSGHISARIGGGLPPAAADGSPDVFPYFSGADHNDPLVSPIVSPAVLAKFPPTLLITGTRAKELSIATHSHIALVKAGVDARLFVWDAMDHGFFINPDMPESQEAYDVMIKFFETQMDKVSGKK